ncbi:uncharacterized protein V1518DRAFT_368601, partial [Limtongia smithiae]|uniref:uncharacterized protein n=1 Tax=Limtongia smithiae TaxID=1125753 RepID=UPI0034CDE25D
IAEVHTFDVLWTAQVSQKSKVWNDGTLKFHTFNRRAMLYSTARVLQDSTFIRKSELREGDTVRMDKHLVNIETRSTSFLQNISSVIAKRRR